MYRGIGKHCYCYLTIPYDTIHYDDDVDGDDDDGNQYHEHVRIRLVLLFHHHKFITPQHASQRSFFPILNLRDARGMEV